MSGQEAREDEREALEEWSFDHRPILSMSDGSIASCTCMDRVFLDGEDWDQHISDSLIAAGYRRHPEPEWEYGVRDVGSRDVFTDVYESVEDMIDDFDGAVAVQSGEEMVKRTKAGPWVPVGEGEQ